MRKEQMRTSYLGGDGHVPDAVLLLALSGELNGTEADRVREHLELCWTCRGRLEKFEQTIQDVVDYRDELVKPHLPLSNGPRAMFIARLEQASRESERTTLWQRLKALVVVPAHSSLFRPAMLGLACVLLAIVMMGRFSSPTPVKLNAEDVLQRAEFAETARLDAISHPVVYREVSVRYNGRLAKKSVYHDSISGKTVEVGAPSSSQNGEIESRLRESHFNVQEPLSVPAYIAWRNTLTQKRDDILHPSAGLITVQTTTASGPLREVDLTLRDGDLHAMAESFRFEDENLVEVAEVNYDVLPFAKVQAGVFTPLPVSRPVLADRTPVGPTTKDLLDAEVKARVVLHVLGADLGEQVEVSTDESTKKVVITGLVDTTARKEELLHALDVVPYAELDLNSVEEAQDNYGAGAAPNRVAVANGYGAPLEESLTSLYPDRTARTEFVNATLAKARKALNSAWALRRLSDRYSPDVTSHLSPNSQRELEVLVRAQVETLQSQLQGLNRSMQPFLGPVTTNSLTDAEESADWHWLVDRTFSSTERIHSDVTVLLSGSAGENVDREAILCDLRNQLEQMSQQLPGFSRRASGKFLTPSPLNAEVR